jgi:hypothetical protein
MGRCWAREPYVDLRSRTKVEPQIQDSFLFFTCLLSSCGGGGSPVSPLPPTPVFSLQLGQENPLLTTAQRASFGLQYGPPDGALGVLLSSGTYMFFAASRSSSTSTGTPLIEGTYRLGGTLTAITAPYGCSALIQPGADPNGYTFDRDYAGGGPVLPISNSTGQTAILHIYHGEWHGGTCANTSVCFYASLGMALSRDGALPLQSWVKSCSRTSLVLPPSHRVKTST